VQLLSGRKKESTVWDYFTYNALTNKNVCKVLNDKGDACGCEISGKKTSNLKTHVKSHHAEVYKVIDTHDKETLAVPPQSKKKKFDDNDGMHLGLQLTCTSLEICRPSQHVWSSGQQITCRTTRTCRYSILTLFSFPYLMHRCCDTTFMCAMLNMHNLQTTVQHVLNMLCV